MPVQRELFEPPTQPTAQRLLLSRGREVRCGDRVRIDGGPRCHGQTLGPRGVFRVLAFVERRRRIYVELARLDDDGQFAGRFTLFAQGKPYRRATLPGVVFRPYRVRKVKS